MFDTLDASNCWTIGTARPTRVTLCCAPGATSPTTLLSKWIHWGATSIIAALLLRRTLGRVFDTLDASNSQAIGTAEPRFITHCCAPGALPTALLSLGIIFHTSSTRAALVTGHNANDSNEDNALHCWSN